MTIPYVGRCLGSGEAPREGSVRRAAESGIETGVCVACSGRFEVRDGRVADHETASDDERERAADVPPARSDETRGPTPEEELRGAQPPNADPAGGIAERELRRSGNTADVVDLDRVDETGSGRSAHRSSP